MPRKHLSASSERGKESEETRRMLLQAARRLFLDFGYQAVTTRQVTDACGLTHPALYHYFSGKEDLYVAMILDEIARLHAALERITQRHEQSVTERLRRATLFLLSTTDYDFALMQHDIGNELHQAAKIRVEEAFLAGVLHPLSAIFVAGQQNGELHTFHKEQFDATAMAGLLLTLTAHFITDPFSRAAGHAPHAASPARADLIMDLLLHGIAARSPRHEERVGKE